MGANLENIVGLLPKDFILLVFIAIMIATPLSWYVMSRWLEGLRTEWKSIRGYLSFQDFWALFIAVLTISYQSIRSAVMNPVSSLRSE